MRSPVRHIPSLRVFLRILCLSLVALAGAPAHAGAPKITEEALRKVHAAYLEAKKQGFTPEALAQLYSTPEVPDVAATVKKLVDLQQSRPDLAISPDDSQAMEKTRQAMNMRVLCELAASTAGSVEVMDAGKQNGIRSDKDLMIFAVLDGKKYVSATDMKKMYEDRFKEIHGIALEKMDMTIFDGDAMIPDWRKTSVSFDEFVEKYQQGQAKLEQNPEAVREGGTWRQGAELRYATHSRVTLVRPAREGEPPGQSASTPFELRDVEMKVKPADPSMKTQFAVIEAAPVKEASARYAAWSKDLPYRNAMDASFEWWQRFEHTEDFVDRMKYFNRTVGDGVNALAVQGWDVQYIFHLAKLEARATGADEKAPRNRTTVDAFIHRMVRDVYADDCSPDMVEHFEQIIKLGAYIELDKMCGKSQPEKDYLAPIIADVQKEHQAKMKSQELLPEDEALSRARERFFDFQRQVMRYNLMLTARQKLRMDLGDSERLKRLRAKFTDPAGGHDGKEEVEKLTWETWRQVGRIIEQLNDDVLIGRLISDAPESLRPKLEELHETAKLKRVEADEARRIALAQSDPKKAAETGPEEKVLTAGVAQLVERETLLKQLREKIGAPIDEFKADFAAGEYSDDAITARLRERMLESLGYEERVVFNKMQAEFETKFRASNLIKNVVSLGNVNSALNVLLVYQQTGDMQQVAQAALWELVSNLPYVNELATLRQSFNDGNYEGLTWLYIAWQIPAAGEVKLAFDVAKGALTLVYNHAMDPLKDDRFSQVYMGYVEAQPAGWSPFKPGWKERRDAAGLSILHFVPGDTFDEKRTNLYRYFDGKLAAKLKGGGIEPTSERYAKVYDEIIEPYFRTYVLDYFNAAGEWQENTTAGLHAIGQQEELRQRVIAQLVSDFRQGQRNFEKMEVARAKMEEALGQMDALGRRGVEFERNRLATCDAVGAALAKEIAAAAPKADDLKPGGKPVLRVAASPAVVQEGQQATITAQVVCVDAAESGEPPVIEVKRVAPAPGGHTGILSRDQAAAGLEDDVFFIQSLLDDPEAPKKQFYDSDIEYEVTAKTRDGQIIGTEQVRVSLVGSAKPAGDQNVQVKLIKITEHKPAPGATGAKGSFDDVLQSEAITRTSEYIDYDPSLVTPFNCASEGQATAGWCSLGLSLWVRWKDAPINQPTYALMHITGGTPTVDHESGQWTGGKTDFVGTEKNPAQNGGNCFRISPEFPSGCIGSFHVDGKLQVYPRPEYDETKRRAMKPLQEFAFTAEFEVPDPPRSGKGAATISPNGDVSMAQLSLKNCQAGKRPARVSFGGRDRWFWLDTKGNDGSVYFSDMHNCAEAATAIVTYRDYGHDASVSVPIEIKKPKYVQKPLPQETLNRARADIETLKKNEASNLLKLAYAYGGIAEALRSGGWQYKEAAQWKEAMSKYLDYYERAAVAAIPNADSQGYRAALLDAINQACSGDDLGFAEDCAAKLEKAAAAVAGKESSLALVSGWTALAEMTFAVKGDADAARALYIKAQTLAGSARGQPYTPGPTPYDVDAAFK